MAPAADVDGPALDVDGSLIPGLALLRSLEETYAPSAPNAAVPTVVFHGTKPGRDKERSIVKAEEAQLWLSATSAKAASKAVALETDWYVLQEEAGVRTVLTEVRGFMQALA